MAWSRQRVHELIDEDTLRDLYFDRGLSLAAVANATGTNYRVVRDSFRAHGLQWRTKSEARGSRSPDVETRNKIAASRRGHKDAPEVAARKPKILETAGGRGWNRGLTAKTDVRVARQQAAATAAVRTPEYRAAQSKRKAAQIAAGGYYDRGYYNSTKAGRIYFMSGWERRRWEELDKDPEVSRFERHPCQIQYPWRGVLRRYLPDVLIFYTDGRVVLEEIKPRRIVEDSRKKQNRVAAKLDAGAQYAQQQGWEWRILSYRSRGGAPFTFV